MSGPSDQYLAQFAPFMMGGTSTTPIPSGAPGAPAPNASGYPSLTDLASVPMAAPLQVPPPPPAPIGPPPPPPVAPIPGPNMSLPTDDPNAMVSRPPPNASEGPKIQVGAEPAPQPSPPPAHNDGFPLVAIPGSGKTPAHEIERRGPSLLGAQALRNDMTGAAIDTVAARNDAAAHDEYTMALQQEREARNREQAVQRSIAERDEELQQRQQDFDSTATQMSQAGTVDQGRFWASRSTPQKIAGIGELLLAGFRGSQSMLTKRIDDDVRAQEFAYYATRDAASVKQNAFGMAMQKYQNIDAARAMATAASIGVTQAQLGQIAANWKGTDSANRASEAIAQLQNEKMAQIANGVQFVPSQARGAMYIDPETGLPYDLAGAHKVAEKWRENRQADRMKTADVGGQLLVQSAKPDTAKVKDDAERTVVLDGKDALATNKTAAEKWNEYNHGRAVFSDALEGMKEARANGDVGSYNAYRATAIEEYPKLLGYTRAPTASQINVTVGPETIPEYNHWYNHVVYGPAGAVTKPVADGRAAEKMKALDKVLVTSDKAMRENTFGAEVGKKSAPVGREPVKDDELPKSAKNH